MKPDLALLLKNLPDDVPVMPIGLGSNLLVRDGQMAGVVVRLGMRGFGSVTVEDRASSGLVARCRTRRSPRSPSMRNSAASPSNHGIPGGIGGALRMNAGANGGETCERVVEVRAVTRSGEIVTLSNAEMGYAYRHFPVPRRI